MDPLETYLESLHDIYSSGAGVPKTSGYGPLANLFNEVGKALKPRIRCIINIVNKGAGLPDGGLFTPDQFQKRFEETGDAVKLEIYWESLSNFIFQFEARSTL